MRSGAEPRTPSALGVPSGPAIGRRKGVGSRIEPKPAQSAAYPEDFQFRGRGTAHGPLAWDP